MSRKERKKRRENKSFGIAKPQVNTVTINKANGSLFFIYYITFIYVIRESQYLTLKIIQPLWSQRDP